MRALLDEDSAQAAAIFREYDARVPRGRYELAFDPRDDEWLGGLIRRDDLESVTVAFEIACTVGLLDRRVEARDRLAALVGRSNDANALIHWLLRWQELGILTTGTTELAIGSYVKRATLAQDRQLWTTYFADVAQDEVPDLFEVRVFLGHGRAAVGLARSPRQQQEAMECCLTSPRIEDAEAGLGLARTTGADARAAQLADRLGDLHAHDGGHRVAIAYYRAAGNDSRVSRCHEALGELREAVCTCPAGEPERLADLVVRSQSAVADLLHQQDFLAAARQLDELTGQLGRTQEVPAVLDCRTALTLQRDAVTALGRRHYGAVVDRCEATRRQEVFAEWSLFEEAVGELSPAAERAEDANDPARAVGLFHRAGRHGEVLRLNMHDPTPEGLAARAASREAGGDLVGAARIYDEAGLLAEAADRYFRAERYVQAARCLLRWLRDDAVEDPRLAECLRQSGDVAELVHICLNAVEQRGSQTRALEELRRLSTDVKVPEQLRYEAETTLSRVDGEARRQFEQHIEAWVREARATVDARFSRIWGLDLGTSTCCAAIYDTAVKQPVPSTWGGPLQFASTLGIDDAGEERVGLSGHGLLQADIVDYISGSKRRMGTGKVDRVRNRLYRPEQVAAHLISHAREQVERYLAEQVREEIGRRASAELGEVRSEWLDWADRHHDLTVSRDRLVVTIPAYFSTNAKSATRAAGEIAGVTIEQLIHEPTAACIDATRERRLKNGVVVADLGGGTLDFSILDVGDNVFMVSAVRGNNQLGGNDFNAAIVELLERQLRSRGLLIPVGKRARRQLDVAAEMLKVELSERTEADYTLVGFNGSDVTVRLTRDELAGSVSAPLQQLRDHCVELRASWGTAPDNLLLIGAPMRSPLIQRVFEDALGLRSTRVTDNRLAVANGAAMLGASRDGKLDDEQLIMDVTPFDLGIRVAVNDQDFDLSVLIAADSTIPVKRSQDFTTRYDNQEKVLVEVFNSHLGGDETKIGEFELAGIEPAPRGTPVIKVTFAINTSCLLTVTALDVRTGVSRSLEITDPTLLTPDQVAELKRDYLQKKEWEKLGHELTALMDESDRVTAAHLQDEFRGRLERFAPGAGVRPDERTERVLGEMFAGARLIEAEVLAWLPPLRDLTLKTRQHLARHRTEGATAGLQTGLLLKQQLTEMLEPLRPGLAKLAHWNAVLHGLELAEPDPVLRFRRHVDSAEYVAALKIAGGTECSLVEADDIRRHLHCLAHTDDLDGYRATLTSHANLLVVTSVSKLRPESFAGVIDAATATVRVPSGGPHPGEGDGFLVSDRHLIIDRHLLGDTTDGAGVIVELDSGRVAVEKLFVPEDSAVDLAVLRLAAPVSAVPLRLGYPRLVSIGDELWAGGTSTAQPPRRCVHSAVVDDLRSLGGHLPMIKLGESATRLTGTGPVVTDLGEVVGVVTARHRQVAAAGTFAFSVAAILPLLRDAGWQRFESPEPPR
ncbi:Hsp70 family protein [Micromonospora sp. WMMD987]|uniref:Hsp70 family protein n=1 Tax=Micromonospora sp. WMMD987 TaxID=3016089 RepID=UPI00249B3DB8|nr:Hsp70 family protein [Micromonospora sp. WMMD987]WFE97525.1 Hsp70 family protein [Micromonospora sp. WMMD987]